MTPLDHKDDKMSVQGSIKWDEDDVSYEQRCEVLRQKGLVVWMTGLSGSGKSTIARELQKTLTDRRYACYRLDGDNIRHGLNADLGFSKDDRDENIRRIAHVAALFQDAGLIVLVSFISPYEDMRRYAKQVASPDHFLTVYVKASLDTCKKRDVKGLYRKAEEGKIRNFTGVDDPYQAPENPDVVLDTDIYDVKACTDQLMQAVLLRVDKSTRHKNCL